MEENEIYIAYVGREFTTFAGCFTSLEQAESAISKALTKKGIKKYSKELYTDFNAVSEEIIGFLCRFTYNDKQYGISVHRETKNKFYIGMMFENE